MRLHLAVEGKCDIGLAPQYAQDSLISLAESLLLLRSTLEGSGVCRGRISM